MRGSVVTCGCLTLFALGVFYITPALSEPQSSYKPWPELAELERELELRRRYESLTSKRGLDLGFDRGYSGKMAAKYLTGLELAGPMGPGRKRRNGNKVYNWGGYEQSKRGLDFGFLRDANHIDAARALIGIEEANNPYGPGRRRRSIEVPELA